MVLSNFNRCQKKRLELENLKTLFALGIAPGDAIELMKYEEIGWFLIEAFEIKRKREIEQLIATAEAVRMGTLGASSKENLELYKKWLADHKAELVENPGELGEGKTLFDRLKENVKTEKVKTFFEKLKGA